MPILNFHNISASEPDEMDRAVGTRMGVQDFASLVGRLRERYTLLPLNEYAAACHRADAATLTFDDGYHGVLDHAFPLLQQHGISASVFVVTSSLTANRPLIHFEELEIAFRLTEADSVHLGFIGGSSHRLGAKRAACFREAKQRLRMLPDAERQRCQRILLDRLEVTPALCVDAAGHQRFQMLSIDELQRLREAGWTIGSHTRTHRVLSRLEENAAREEVFGSLTDLREALGLKSMPFAYPYGGANHIAGIARKLVQEAGYTFALTMQKLPNITGSFELHRVDCREWVI